MGEHETSLKVRDALAASQDAEILRLRGALEKIAQIQREKCAWADAEMLLMVLENKVEIARAALSSSPAPQDDVIVPRALGWRLCSQNDGIRETAQRELRALLGAPARG